MADAPFIQQCMETPVTALTCLLLIVIWFPLWNNRIGVDTVAFSYTRVVTHHEWWRVLSASHAHFDPFHLLFNIMALWSCRPVEYMLGPSWIFFIQSLTFAVACKLIMIGVLHVASKQFPQQTRGWLEQWTVGYSAVIFAWMTVLAAQANGIISVFGLVDVPAHFAPVVSLLITQVLVRNASFIGHAAGIVAGGLHILGLFNWLASPYWAAVWGLWVAGVAAVSLRATTQVPVPCISYVNCWGEDGSGHEGSSSGHQPQQQQRGGGLALLAASGQGRTLGGGPSSPQRNGPAASGAAGVAAPAPAGGSGPALV